MILGGLDSVPGAVVGGAIIGLLSSYTGGYIGGGLRDGDPLHRAAGDPAGQALRPLRPGPDRAGLSRGHRDRRLPHQLPGGPGAARTRAPSTSAWRWRSRPSSPLPFLVSPYWLTIVNQIGIAVIGAIGLNILVGFTGQISLGQGGFLAVGAYTSGLLAAQAGLPFAARRACAALATAAIGTLFGLPALRLKGLYLAIATLAVAADHPLGGHPLGRRHRRHVERSSSRRPSCSAGRSTPT